MKRRRIRTEIVTLPAFLAPALINGDMSGLEERDLYWVDKVHEYIAPGRIVDVGDPYFAHSCELPGWRKGCDVADYTVLYREEG